MPKLRIGIDVGGTFTHGVVLRPPGDVLHTAVTPTTHTHEHGVAGGVKTVLMELVAKVDASEIELVAHSTTQATNALLEGDVASVERVVIVPPGEMLLCRNSLKGDELDIGNGHSIALCNHFINYNEAEVGEFAALNISADNTNPVAVIQPLAGELVNLEHKVAEQLAHPGRPVVCAGDITQVLGLQARARTAVVNASMLPTMLATAEYTQQAVDEVLPGVPVQVVRSDGGAMSLDEMRRMPVLSLLSGPAAGASAALHRTGLSEVIFIEVGGTSTDITLISGGRVRHRYATVGGQRLMVPALDLRTVAVGGGSMLRWGAIRFGPRSAHKAGLPYLFQAVRNGRRMVENTEWVDPKDGTKYLAAKLDDGTLAALTFTDFWIDSLCCYKDSTQEQSRALLPGLKLTSKEIDDFISGLEEDEPGLGVYGEIAMQETGKLISDACDDLLLGQNLDVSNCRLIAGGGGAPALVSNLEIDPTKFALSKLLAAGSLIDHYPVISAIGAALAVTCVSQSKSVAEPTGADIAELVSAVESKLNAQGAERVSTDFEFDPQRQVLTVTGRGNRPYDQDAGVLDETELAAKAAGFIGEGAGLAWDSGTTQLYTAEKTGKRTLLGGATKSTLAVAMDNSGRSLWCGNLQEHFTAEAGSIEQVLSEIVERRTQYTDGGPALPGLALLTCGRLIPLDMLGSLELVQEALRWENIPQDASGCFLLR